MSATPSGPGRRSERRRLSAPNALRGEKKPPIFPAPRLTASRPMPFRDTWLSGLRVGECASAGASQPMHRDPASEDSLPPLRRYPDACPQKRSEAHMSETPSLMRISYDVFCLKKKTI